MWRETFTDSKGKVGGPLSDEQCYAAREIFGEAIPGEIDRACGQHTKDLAAELAYKVLSRPDVMRQIADIEAGIKGIVADIEDLKKFQRKYEAEKQAWQSRGHRAMFGGSDAWPTLATPAGEKEKPYTDWLHAMAAIGKPAFGEAKGQDDPRHRMMQGWYKRSWL